MCYLLQAQAYLSWVNSLTPLSSGIIKMESKGAEQKLESKIYHYGKYSPDFSHTFFKSIYIIHNHNGWG